MKEKKKLCPLGEQIAISLIKANRTNEWLIREVASDSGRYFDRSYLHKVKTGKIQTPSIVSSIKKILELE
jgi:hypothetical protein